GTQALATARNIARGSPVALTALKRHLAERAAIPIAAHSPLPPAEATIPQDTPRRVPLASDVVTLERYANSVALVTLCNRAGKNTFSPAFVSGVIAAFEHLSGNPDYKAVVLTGFDTYFACGGTREGLLDIQSGRARFTDEQSYAMPLRCDIPV